jgi:hypothetical protein
LDEVKVELKEVLDQLQLLSVFNKIIKLQVELLLFNYPKIQAKASLQQMIKLELVAQVTEKY